MLGRQGLRDQLAESAAEVARLTQEAAELRERAASVEAERDVVVEALRGERDARLEAERREQELRMSDSKDASLRAALEKLGWTLSTARPGNFSAHRWLRSSQVHRRAATAEALLSQVEAAEGTAA